VAASRVPSLSPILALTLAGSLAFTGAHANSPDSAPARGTFPQGSHAAQPLARPAGLQPTPKAIRQLLGSVPAYALEMTLSFSRQYSLFDAASPANSTAVGPPPADTTLWTGTFVGNDFSKEYLIGDANVLRTISTSDGTVTDIGPAVSPVDGEYWVGMKWDPTTDTVFAAACNHALGAGCHLYSIDPTTAAVTPVAPIAEASGDYVLLDIAINSAGDIYAVNIIDPYDNYLVKIDKVTGDVQVIGPTGVNAAYAQGLDFDKSTDTLYWAAFGALGSGGAFQGQVYTVDTSSGAVTWLGTTPNGGSEIWALAIATSAPQNTSYAWNFDDVAAPALPSGWTTDAIGVDTAWTTQTDVFDSAPNAAHIPEAVVAGEASLYSPVVTPAAGSELAFRHRWTLETSPYDGGVLEISIDGAPFDDIVTAGGSFVSGGYTATMFGCCGGNPIGPRDAWAGETQPTFINTRVTLPPAAAGHAVQFRWRFGTDSSTAAPGANGWWVDTVSLGAPGPSGPAAALSAASLALDVQTNVTTAKPIGLTNVGGAALDYSTAFASSDCASPGGVSWLTSTPPSGSLEAGASKNLWIAINASSMPAGDYSAVLCVTTSDPDHAVFSVPVSATVTATPPSDDLFCSGFEFGEDGRCSHTSVVGDIVSNGPLNWPVPADLDGLAIDLVTGAHGPWSADTIADINLYAADDDDGNGDTLHVYWYSDLVTEAAVGGVIDVSTAGGVHYSVLQSGAWIGQDNSVWIAPNSEALDNWLPGATGYLGIAFYNEQTGQLNYGYVHVQAGDGAGFPATVLDYAYDRSGNAITIP